LLFIALKRGHDVFRVRAKDISIRGSTTLQQWILRKPMQNPKTGMRGSGAMISSSLKGRLDAGRKLINSVEFCVLAGSLGGIETLIQHPASVTHSKLSAKQKDKEKFLMIL
jgi:hypothetical protein